MDLYQMQKKRRPLAAEEIVGTTADDVREKEVIVTNDALFADDGDTVPFQAI